MATVIIGAGIIGSATAFYLSQESSSTPADSIHVIESSPELIASASGYAAGFIARDWFSHSSASLGALSFDLHKELAETHSGAEGWGYTGSTATSFTRSPPTSGEDWVESGSRAQIGGPIHEVKPSNLPAWFRRSKHDDVDIIGEDGSAAQVDPLRLSKFLLDSAVSRGIHLHYPARPSSLILDFDNTPSSINIISTQTNEITELPCTRLIITAGAWTPSVYKTLFPKDSTRIPITQLAGHSLLLRSPLWKAGDELPNQAQGTNSSLSLPKGGCHAVFSTATGPDDRNDWSPETFSRAGGEIYIAGLNDPSLPLPEIATDRKLEPKKLAVLMEEAQRLIGGAEKEEELEVLREGLCFRPVTRRGTPIIAEVRPSVWVAAGHDPWGISLSLGTGKVVSEMVEGRTTSADVSALGL